RDLYRSTSSGQKGSLLASGVTLPYDDDTAENGTTYYYTLEVSAGEESDDTPQVSATPEAPSALHPNEPAGMTVLGSADGSVASNSNGAFGIQRFGGWYGHDGGGSQNVSVVDDAGNPTGSGKAVRLTWASNGGAEAAIADMSLS